MSYLTGQEEERYLDYQEKYRKEMRESDTKLIEFMAPDLNRKTALPDPYQTVTILDVGCSTGNLIYWLAKKWPEAIYVGIDSSEKAINRCRYDPALAYHTFVHGDILTYDAPTRYDCIILNAFTWHLTNKELDKLFKVLKKHLKPSGMIVGFEMLSPFEVEMEIKEYSKNYPEGLMLYIRSHNFFNLKSVEFGFKECLVQPFRISKILRLSSDPANIDSYTVPWGDYKAIMRHMIYQPWVFFKIS